MKSAQIGSCFWSLFSCIRTEYGDLRSKSRIQPEYRKIRTINNSVFGHFPCSVIFLRKWLMATKTNSNPVKHLRWSSFPKICYRLQRRIQNLAKHLRWSFCKNSYRQKAVSYLRKILHLGCLAGFWICF